MSTFMYLKMSRQIRPHRYGCSATDTDIELTIHIPKHIPRSSNNSITQLSLILCLPNIKQKRTTIASNKLNQNTNNYN